MSFIQEELYLRLLEINRIVSGYVWNHGSDWSTDGSEFSLLEEFSKPNWITIPENCESVCYLLTSTSITSIQLVLEELSVLLVFFSFFTENYKDSSSEFLFLLKADLYCQAHTMLWTWFHSLKDLVLRSTRSTNDWLKRNSPLLVDSPISAQSWYCFQS